MQLRRGDLGFHELEVRAAPGEQFLVSPVLYNPAPLDDDDEICVADRAQSVRNDDPDLR